MQECPVIDIAALPLAWTSRRCEARIEGGYVKRKELK
jgi:hypothetical protein